MRKRLLILLATIIPVVAQQALPAFTEGITWEVDDCSFEELSIDGFIPYPEIELVGDVFDDGSVLKAPPRRQSYGETEIRPISGVVSVDDGLAFLLIFSALFISYKRLKAKGKYSLARVSLMKPFLSRAKRGISRSTKERLTSLRLQSGKQSTEKNRKPWVASSFILAMALLCCISNVQAQDLIAKPINTFISSNDGRYKWSEADGGTDAFTGATINVLENDELGACTQETIIVRITQAPTKGTAVVIGDNDTRGLTKNRILYTVNHGDNKNFTESGQDVLRYEIECNGTTSDEVEVLINISEQPDNIVWDGCFVNPKAMKWGMEETAVSSKNVHQLCTPFAGDLDGDGIPEVVAPYSEINHSTGICIFDNNLQLIKLFDTPTMHDYGTTTLLIADVDNDEFGEIVIAARYTNNEADAARLICYDRNGNRKWTSNQPYATSDVGPSLIIADIDGDGKAEILANNKIFAAESGKLLVSLPAGGIGQAPLGPENAIMPAFADLDNDGKMEVIGGNTSYSVSITNREGTDGNTVTVLAQAIGPDGIIMPDGFTSIADIDGDGDLDVVVTTSEKAKEVTMYVWEGATSDIIGTVRISKEIDSSTDSRRISRAFIGDITGNGQADIAFISSAQMHAYTYNDEELEELWTLTIYDASGATGVTMFDFNQDGISELIYRDQYSLRIINGSGKHHQTGASTGPYGLVSKDCFSSTHTEYPIVVGMDKNGGSACILVSGRKSYGNISKTETYIHKYESSTSDQWAWARPVWNQYAYNPVYVNDDLTIPANPMNPATTFIDKNGVEHRPYNNFLQQATQLDYQGKMFSYGPDLLFDSNNTDGIDYGVKCIANGNDYYVTLYVTNNGDAAFPSPLQISAYNMVKDNNGTFPRIYSGSHDVSIAVGETKDISFTIKGVVSTIPDHLAIQFRLNDGATGLPFKDDDENIEEECHYYNNYSYAELCYVSPLPAIACEGDKITLNMYPGNTYVYKWYASATGGSVLNTGDSYTITRSGEELQKLYVEVYENNVLLNPDERYVVNVYLTPKELVWTGAGENNDWHDYKNWYDPNDPTPNYPFTKIPRKCTNVLIPDGLDYYANLSETKTNYTTYSTPQCADIRFEFGGEVARTDLLDYERAFVQYNFGYYEDGKDDVVVKQGFVTEKGGNSYTPSHMARDRYYALSAPLNKMVTGDFCVGGKPNTWQQAFIQTKTSDNTWIGEFEAPANTNDIELDADLGYAIALWVAGDTDGLMGEDRDLHNGYQSSLDGLKGIIEIPYFENEAASDLHLLHSYENGTSYFYYYYYQIENFPQASNTPGSIARAGEAYRFIFDKKVTADGKFTISVPAGSDIMIGNPTMSTMDFDAFYAENTSKMENFYRTFNSENFDTNNAFTQVDINANGTEPIAPMQAFFIKTKGTVGDEVDLVYPFATASITRATGASHELRSATDEDCHCGLDFCHCGLDPQSPDNRRGSRIKSGMTEIGSGMTEIKSGMTDVMTMQIKAEQAGYTSRITLVLNETGIDNIEQLFYPYAENTPQLYLKDETGKRNAVQFEGKEGKEIPLGIQLEKESTVTLSFNNTENLPLDSLILVDTKTGLETDLLKTNTYTFAHDTDGDRFVLRMGRLRNVSFTDEFDVENTLSVYPEGKRIVVSSNQSITAVEVYDTQGRSIIQQTGNDGLFVNDSGIYIVRVTLATGERKTVKIAMR